MSTLCTFPGRYGDLLWSMPSIRAISEQRGEPVSVAIAGEFASLLPLLAQQPYIRRVHALSWWSLTPPNEWESPIDLSGPDWRDYDELIDLGYRGWPTLPLPYEIAQQAKVEIDLSRPWITVDGPGMPLDVAVGFTETWFELKFGLLVAIEHLLYPSPSLIQLTLPKTRWTTETARYAGVSVVVDWLEAARAIRNADLFFGDCSALHVLAVAIGTPVVLCEPMEARWNPIFYPLGMAGPQVTVVTGNDGKPTFDARHCADAIRSALTADVRR